MIALFAALPLEIQHFLRRLEVPDRARVDGFPVTVGELDGKPLLVCCTGPGRRAGEAAAAVLGQHMPWAVVVVGLGGALSPQCRVGDLVLAEWVHLEELEALSLAGEGPIQSDAGLLDLARRAATSQGLRHWIGGSLTVGRVVGERGQKAALRRVSGLDVVEMESYWVGQVAQRLCLPFLAVRAICDGPDDAVPDIPGIITPEGDLRGRRALSYAVRYPARIPGLLRMARAQSKAVANLTRFLEVFVSAYQTSLVGKPAAR